MEKTGRGCAEVMGHNTGYLSSRFSLQCLGFLFTAFQAFPPSQSLFIVQNEEIH